MSNERRQYRRLYYDFPMEYRSKKYLQYVQAKNISAGGTFISTNMLEPPDTYINLLFEFGQNRKHIETEGKVIWNRTEPKVDILGKIQPTGMGIIFTKIIPMDSKQFIDKTIGELSSSN